MNRLIKRGSYKQSFTLLRNALIAGSGTPLDSVTYGLSAPQQLAAFAPPPSGPPDAGRVLDSFPASLNPEV